MTTSQRQDVEDAVIDKLVAELSVVGNPASGYLHFVEPYNGEIDQTEGFDDMVRFFRGRFPAIGISATSGQMNSIGMSRRAYRRNLAFELYVASNHMRGRANQNRADVASQNDPNVDPGIYKIIEDVHFVISGDRLQLSSGDCTGAVMPQRENVLLQNDTFTVWRMEFDVLVPADLEKLDFSLTPLESTLISGNLDPDEVTEPPNPFAQSEIDHTV